MKLNVKMYDKYFLCKKNRGFGADMGYSPPMGTRAGIPQNLLNGDGFREGGGDGIVIPASTRPVAIPTPS